MSNKTLTLREYAKKLNKQKYKATFLGVGPVSKIAVKATFAACKKYNCPPIFIASRNQVDLKALGHGYLMGGMDQKKFVDLINMEKISSGYKGPVYICRDHGGPWQRNVELDNKYPIDKAMKIGKESFAADIKAGFNYIHIDPTKCPHKFNPDQLIDWTIELMIHCEDVRIKNKLPEIDYEVGTEDIQGGLTTNKAFEDFLKKLVNKLKENNLPLPTCIVGQTGTLTKLDKNVGHFDKVTTKKLVNIAAKYDVGFKEHNGDYLSAATCRIHPDVGVTGMNVAPEYGLIETEAYLELALLEDKLVRERWITQAASSNLIEMMLDFTFKYSPWHKWITKDLKSKKKADIAKDRFLRMTIARVCGHYEYDKPEIKKAINKLLTNINKHKLVDNAEKFVSQKVQESIEFYLEHFNLKDINKKILK